MPDDTPPMIESLFGDLAPRRLPSAPARAAARADADADDLYTGPLYHDGRRESNPPTAAQAQGPQAIDLLVDSSPAEAMRLHFASSRADLGQASARITLIDPSRLWASDVIQALSQAAASPVQRLNLRERSTLRTLAVVERTTVPRRGADALRVYHADMHTGGLAYGLTQEEITQALAEGSQLTAVIVGNLQPHALVALLRSLLAATRQPEWRCPWLLFILPPAAAALRQRILDQPWPAHVGALAVTESQGSIAAVWNCVLGAWQSTQQAMPTAAAEVPADDDHQRQGPAARRPESAPAAPSAPGHRLPARVPLPLALGRLLAPLSHSDGLLACGIVDLDSGDLLASQVREQPQPDLAAIAQALCAARLAHIAVGGADNPAAAPDEMLVTLGSQQSLLRQLPGGARLGFVALLDRHQANLALLRFKLLDAERLLA